ncbi:S1 family peptidase [Rhodococcus maanshanensis]|uniref:Uncharacterized protein n=1 Tax=Rhodococcus maanshanensis TaxID=183556 RepID=A0A1H7RB69_9NOCA|nr:S1 family peptidase [Rhodococcus maanshanensis]SEL57570.1 hypothetical protein SAMN05444583_11129 [Rhodococcus maanshanensis]
MIKIDQNFAKRFENNYVRAPGQDPVAITGTADPVEGMPVCMSGRVTGYHCGTVGFVDIDTIPLWPSRFTVNICGLGGDSGGAVLSGTTALGIAVRSNKAIEGTCDSATVPEVTATPITNVLAGTPGLKIRTN